MPPTSSDPPTDRRATTGPNGVRRTKRAGDLGVDPPGQDSKRTRLPHPAAAPFRGGCRETSALPRTCHESFSWRTTESVGEPPRANRPRRSSIESSLARRCGTIGAKSIGRECDERPPLPTPGTPTPSPERGVRRANAGGKGSSGCGEKSTLRTEGSTTLIDADNRWGANRDVWAMSFERFSTQNGGPPSPRGRPSRSSANPNGSDPECDRGGKRGSISRSHQQVGVSQVSGRVRPTQARRWGWPMGWEVEVRVAVGTSRALERRPGNRSAARRGRAGPRPRG